MAYDEKTLKRDGSGITPVPQHFNPTINDYEPIYGRNNAGRVEIYGPDGNPISVTLGSAIGTTGLLMAGSDGTNARAIKTTSDGTLLTQLSGSTTEAVVFHDEAVAASNGASLTVSGYKTLVVEINRTAGSSSVAFMGEGDSGTAIPLMGVNLSTFATATSTTGTAELWQFDITGLTKVFMDLTAVVTGPVSVKGKAVA